MIEATLAFVLAIAAVMTLLLSAVCFSLGLCCRGARMFALLSVAIWFGGRSGVEVGPLLWGVPWMTLFLAGLVAAAFCLCLMIGARSLTRRVASHLDALASHPAEPKASLAPLHFRVRHPGT